MKHKPKQLLQFTQAQAFLFLENHFFWVKSSSSRREIRPIFPGTAFSELYTRILKEVLWNECDVGGGGMRIRKRLEKRNLQAKTNQSNPTTGAFLKPPAGG